MGWKGRCGLALVAVGLLVAACTPSNTEVDSATPVKTTGVAAVAEADSQNAKLYDIYLSQIVMAKVLLREEEYEEVAGAVTPLMNQFSSDLDSGAIAMDQQWFDLYCEIGIVGAHAALSAGHPQVASDMCNNTVSVCDALSSTFATAEPKARAQAFLASIPAHGGGDARTSTGYDTNSNGRLDYDSTTYDRNPATQDELDRYTKDFLEGHGLDPSAPVYGSPQSGQTLSEYIQEQDPGLWDDMQQRWDGVVGD